MTGAAADGVDGTPTTRAAAAAAVTRGVALVFRDKAVAVVAAVADTGFSEGGDDSAIVSTGAVSEGVDLDSAESVASDVFGESASAFVVSPLASAFCVVAAATFFGGGAGAVRPLPVRTAAVFDEEAFEAGVSPLLVSEEGVAAFFAASFSFQDSPPPDDEDVDVVAAAAPAPALTPRGSAEEVTGFVVANDDEEEGVDPAVPHFFGATAVDEDAAPLVDGVTPAAVDSEPRLLPAAEDGPADDGPAEDVPELPAGFSSNFSFSASLAASAALSAAFCCQAGTTLA